MKAISSLHYFNLIFKRGNRSVYRPWFSTGYFFSNKIQFNEINKPLKTQSSSSPGIFAEQQFMSRFLSFFTVFDPRKELEKKELYQILKQNLKEIQNLQSLVALLDQSFRFNVRLQKNVLTEIQAQIINIIENDYSVFKNNGGDLLRALVLIYGINKQGDQKFYEVLIQKILSQLQHFRMENLTFIVESLFYNKIVLQKVVPEGATEQLLLYFNQQNLIHQNINEFSQIINIIGYLQKNRQNEEFKKIITKSVDEISQNIILQIYNCLYGVITNFQQNSDDIFLLAELTNSLQIFLKISKNADLNGIHQRHKQNLTHLFQKLPIVENVNERTEKQILRYVKRYMGAPPVYLDNYILTSVLNLMQRGEHGELTNLLPLLYFCSKTLPNFRLPYQESKRMISLVKKERNLVNLAKLYEVFATVGYTQDQELLQVLQERIIALSKNSPNPAFALLITMQSLAFINKGTSETWKYLFEFFSYPNIIEKIDLFEVIVQLVPSLAIKTKNIFKFYTNISIATSLNIVEGSSSALDQETQSILEQLWDQLQNHLANKAKDIYPDQYPGLLIHFVYANLMIPKYRLLFNKLSPGIIANFHTYAPKQLSEIVYSYSRLLEKNQEIFFGIIPHIKKNITQFNSIELMNIYWGYSNAKIKPSEILDTIENQIFLLLKQNQQVSTEGVIQFVHSAGIFTRGETWSEEQLNLLAQFIQTKVDGSETKVQTHQHNHDHSKHDHDHHEHNHSHDQKGSQPHQHEHNHSLPSEPPMNYQLCFNLAYSLLLLDRHEHFVGAWNKILTKLVENSKTFSKNPVYSHYLYLIFIHLQTSQSAQGIDASVLQNIISDNFLSLQTFFLQHKRSTQSKFQIRITQLIEKQKKELGLEQKDKGYFQCQGDGTQIYFFDDFNKLSEVGGQFGVDYHFIPYTADYRRGPFCFEVNGPFHYNINSQKALQLEGASLLKKQIFEAVGLRYIELKYSQFSYDQKQEVLIQRLQNSMNDKFKENLKSFEEETTKNI